MYLCFEEHLRLKQFACTSVEELITRWFHFGRWCWGEELHASVTNRAHLSHIFDHILFHPSIYLSIHLLSRHICLLGSLLGSLEGVRRPILYINVISISICVWAVQKKNSKQAAKLPSYLCFFKLLKPYHARGTYWVQITMEPSHNSLNM